MDPKLMKLIDKTIPDFNPVIVEGYASKVVLFAQKYIDELLKCANEDFPEGLNYLGCRRLTPLEENNLLSEPKNNKIAIENSKNDIYGVNFDFEYTDPNGEYHQFSKPVFLPYLKDGSLIAIRGALFSINPVLADKGLSYTEDSCFIQIPKAKIIVKKLRRIVLVNKIRKSINVTYSMLYRGERKNIKDSYNPKINTCLAHYLFAKYGVKETFRKYANVNIIIEDLTKLDKTKYPKDKYTFIQSVQTKPKQYHKKREYHPSNLVLIVLKCDHTNMVDYLSAGFFYIVDHYPDRIRKEYLDSSNNELVLWRIILGQIIGCIIGSEIKILEMMDSHIHSLDGYVDMRTKINLQEGDIFVENLYDLLGLMIGAVSDLQIQSMDSIGSMYDKQLMILRYLLREINDGIFTTVFRLKLTQLKKILTIQEVKKLFKIFLNTEAILKIGDSSKHSEVTNINYCGDNKFFKITNNLVLQTDSTGNRKSRKKTGVKIDKTKLLHSSIAEVGSFCILPKTDPIGKNRINPWVSIDEKGNIIRKPEFKPLLDKVQNMIKR